MRRGLPCEEQIRFLKKGRSTITWTPYVVRVPSMRIGILGIVICNIEKYQVSTFISYINFFN